ncbi:hypothetical protein C3488_28835 [Streptomyces sp. Ru72]|nr:hypothetical protein C3488_28835 [Streptomyces sp. Ru72]
MQNVLSPVLELLSVDQPGGICESDSRADVSCAFVRSAACGVGEEDAGLDAATLGDAAGFAAVGAAVLLQAASATDMAAAPSAPKYCR